MSDRRPNRISIERRVEGAQSVTGEMLAATERLNTAVPALVQNDPRGTLQWTAQGNSFVQVALLILDGLEPEVFAGVAPGGTIVVGGITYTVTGNGLGAFPALTYNDRVTDENASAYLTLAVEYYYRTQTLQAQIARGRAWS